MSDKMAFARQEDERPTDWDVANMGLFCAALVVLVHVGQKVPLHAGEGAWWFRRIAVRGLAAMSVPWFFMVSGWYLARHMGEVGWWRREVRKRITTLLVPYVLWVAVYAALAGFECLAHGTSPSFTVAGGVTALGLDFTRNPAAPSCWYVRALMLFVLVSPLVKKLVQRRVVALVSLGLMQVLLRTFALTRASTTTEYFILRGIAAEGLFWFAVGVYLRGRGECNLPKPGRFTASLSFFTALAMGAVGACCDLGRERVAGAFLRTLAIPFWMTAIWGGMPALRIPRIVAGVAFPVFLIHQIFTHAVGMIPKNSLSVDKIATSIPLYLGWWLAVCVVSGGVAIGFKKFLPRLSSLAFGGR